MSSPGFYNENLYRDYPFITRVQPLGAVIPTTGLYEGIDEASSSFLEDLPHALIVDFGCIMEIDATFNEAAGHFVYLQSIHRDDPVFTFIFATNAPGAANQLIIFEVEYPADQQYKIVWSSAALVVPEPVDELACPQVDRWSGFMVAGDLQSLWTLVPNGGSLEFVPGYWQIEPARVQNLRNTYLRSITLANTPRLRVDNAEGCGTNSSELNTDAILQASCIVGEIKLVEGYNCGIRQDRIRNTITINAGVGLGVGEPCEEVPLYPSEVPPADSPYLSGGPGCNEVIKSINGVSGSEITIAAGAGYRILPDTLQTNKLIVERVLGDFALCAEPDPDQIDACVNFYDTFTGTGTLVAHTPDVDTSGNGWLAFRGAFVIGDGTATTSSEATVLRAIALMSTSNANVRLEVEVNFRGTNTAIAHGIAYRWNSFWLTGWLAGIDATNNSFKVWHYNGTAFVLVAEDTFAVNLDTNYRIQVDVRGTGHLCRVYDGNSLLAEVAFNSPLGEYNKQHGIRGGVIIGDEVAFDNFTQCVYVDSSSSSLVPSSLVPSSLSSTSSEQQSSLSLSSESSSDVPSGSVSSSSFFSASIASNSSSSSSSVPVFEPFILMFWPMAQVEEAIATNGTQSSVAAFRAIGRGAFRTNPATTAAGSRSFAGVTAAGVRQNLAVDTAWATFHFRPVTLPGSNNEPIAQIVNNTSTLKLEVRISSGGLLSVYDANAALVATGSTVLSAGTIYRVAIYAGNGAAATYGVYVAPEGDDFTTPELYGTCNQGATQISRIILGKVVDRNGNSVDFYYQDLVVDTVVPWDDFNIGIAMPDGAGTDTGWSGAFTDVDEFAHNSDADYISTASSGVASTFTMQNFTHAEVGGNTDDDIYSVAPCTIRRRVGGSAINQSIRMRSGAFPADTPDANPGTTYEIGVVPYTTDPNTTDSWSQTGFNAVQVGALSNSALDMRVTQVSLWVLFVPGPPVIEP